MKVKLSRILAVFIVVLMLVILFTGCSSETAKTDTKAETETKTETKEETKTEDSDDPLAGAENVEWEYMLDTSETTIDVWFPSCWCRDVWTDGWTDEKAIFPYITSKTGVSLNVDVPTGTEEELLGVMIASNDLPEVIVLGDYTSPYFGQLRDGGYIYDWNSLMDKYCPKMYDLIDDTNWNFHTDDNGVLWQYVGFAYDDDGLQGMMDCGVPPVHENNVMWCRNDVLEGFKAKTGLDDVTTLEQYTDLLYYAHENYPDLDSVGVMVETPRSYLWIHFRSTFGATIDAQAYIDPDGNAKYYIYDPAYVAYLNWLNDLYLDGVISQNMLTYDNSTYDSKFYSAQIATIMSASYTVFNTLEQEIKAIYGDDENYQYSPIGPIKYDENTPWYAATTSTLGAQSTVIAKSTKQPDRIIRFIEYMLTDEGQVTLNCGVEGDTFDYDSSGKIVFKDEIKKLASTDLNKYWIDYANTAAFSPWCDTWYWEHYLGSLITQTDSREYACNTVRLSSYRNYFNAGLIDIKSSVLSNSEEDVIRTKVEDVVVTASVKMIAANSKAEFQKIYDDCIKTIEAENIAAVEKIFTDTYHGYCDNLGINYDLYDNDTEIFG